MAMPRFRTPRRATRQAPAVRAAHQSLSDPIALEAFKPAHGRLAAALRRPPSTSRRRGQKERMGGTIWDTVMVTVKIGIDFVIDAGRIRDHQLRSISSSRLFYQFFVVQGWPIGGVDHLPSLTRPGAHSKHLIWLVRTRAVYMPRILNRWSNFDLHILL